MYSRKFFERAFERTVRTVAQTALGVLGTNAAGLLDVNWEQVVSVSGLAGLCALLMALAWPSRIVKED